VPRVECKPLRPSKGGIAGDIECHLAANHQMGPDPHEQVHGVNSRIRNENRVAVACYILNDKAWTIQAHPKFTLGVGDLADKIPTDQRGDASQLYMLQQQRWWNDEPLYVLDELTAYTLGTMADVEMGNAAEAVFSKKKAQELWRYSRIAQKMARDSGFAHQADLDEFFEVFHKQLFSPMLKLT
jgi:hypothetical protein